MRRVLVTDASVVVGPLGRFAAEPIEAALFEGGGQLVAPELLDIEVLHTLSKIEATKAIPAFECCPFGDFDTPRCGKTSGS